MANHPRAARALFFMQQCRQQINQQARSQMTTHTIRNRSDQSSLDPDSFGKKLRFDNTIEEPIPEWRLPKPESLPTTLQSQLKSTEPSSSSTQQQPTYRTHLYDFPRSREQPIPRHRHNPAIRPGWLSFFKYTVLRFPEPPNPNDALQPNFNIRTNPYRARKQWPPVLNEMTEIEQFAYEKKFRRRLLRKTKMMRTSWDTWALFARRLSIASVVVWCAFIYDPDDPKERIPPDGLRYWLYGKLRQGNGAELGGEGAQFWPRRLGLWFENQYQWYQRKHKRQWDPYNHEGWDTSRPINSLPGGQVSASPPLQGPLGDPTREF